MSPEVDGAVVTELVEWLVCVETLARDVYRSTADALKFDPEVSRFVAMLAENEEQHAELVGRIKDVVTGSKDIPPPDLRLDVALREIVEAPLRRLQSEVASETITRRRALALIAEVEFTEWNDVFLYVLKKYGEQGREMEKMSATIQEHERAVEAFMAGLPPHIRPELDVAKLAKVWDTRLLVVDDNSLLRDVLASILEPIGRVTAVEDGLKALEITRRHFFDAVVSDIRMPRMNGIELHSKAVAEHPDLQNRFLFVSFGPSEEHRDYMTEHQVPFLPKPFSPDELTRAVHRVISAASRGATTAPKDA
jgi:CheY-like chemotaxis protein